MITCGLLKIKDFIPQQMQHKWEKTFLKNIKYIESYWLNDDDKKELRSLLISFSLEQFHLWMKVDDTLFQLKMK